MSLDIGGRQVRVSSPERVLWPAGNVTKAQLIEYYIRIAPVLLPHLNDRPVALARFPEGVGAEGFFQIRVPPHPEWVRTQHMDTFTPGKNVHLVILDDLASLVWAGNLAAVELHPYLSRAAHLDRPDYVVFDFDPGPPAGVAEAARAALAVRKVLTGLALTSFPKTSGGKGIHVYVPLDGSATFPETKTFAHAVAALIAREQPALVTDRLNKAQRAGKVFIDWGQNDHSKSMAAPYSPRARPLPTVSTPLEWDEVEQAAAGSSRLEFGPADVIARVDRKGDLFADVLTLSQGLPRL